MAEYIVQTSAPLGGHFKPGDYEEVYGKVMHEVVCCRDCKHYWTNLEIEYDDAYNSHEVFAHYCSHPMTTEPSSLKVKPNGFCAWGERKSE